MRKILGFIDSVNRRTGSSAGWLCIALVLVGSYDAIMRYAFNAPTVWAYETSCMLGGTIYVMGWGYDHLFNAHVRVDILYTHLSARGKAIADVVGAGIFFFPLMGILVKTSISWMLRAWSINEVMIETYWYPPAAPYRTIFAVGICLFTLQGLVRFIRDLYFVIRNKALD